LEGGEQVLDAGDVVAAAGSSGMAWELGKVATKAWQAAGVMCWRVEVALEGGEGVGGGRAVRRSKEAGGKSSRGKQGSWRWTTRTRL
jgi:hypothetical protein